MSLDAANQTTEIVTRSAQLVAGFEAAETPPARFRVGLEHEKMLVDGSTCGPVPYEGSRGIRALLERMPRFGFTPFMEGDHPIAMQRDGLSISLEPGGQLELSGRPSAALGEIHAENAHHIAQANAIAAELGLSVLGVGYRPFGRIEEMPWMPKNRYVAMRRFLATKGKLAHHMMLMTGSTQASYDWKDESDLAFKLRAAGSVASLVGALFANSAIVNGADSGYVSFRMHVWTDMDPDRCGLLPIYFDGKFSYRKYVDWAMGVPVIFIRREGRYLDPAGRTFRDLMRSGLEGHFPTLQDWDDHLTTLFPEVRIKRVLEVRSADAGDLAMSTALAALMKGLLYNSAGLRTCVDLTRRLRFDERVALHESVARNGMSAKAGRFRVLDLCRELVAAARAGLSTQDTSEVRYLDPIEAIAKEGRTRAEEARDVYMRRRDPAELARYLALPYRRLAA
jgi:glutamate--cysteine ligase